jgi:predicted nucleic acid-binding protein
VARSPPNSPSRRCSAFSTVKLGIVERRPDGLARRAWQLAGQFGWAKTYDAEYLATAELLGCELATVDGRLRRGADRLGYVRTPDELLDRTTAPGGE